MPGLDTDNSLDLQSQVQLAFEKKTPLRIEGGHSKAFYGRDIQGQTLSTRQHSGIINYEPTELVITARAGTPLREIEATLKAHHQMLGFEPPHFGETATLGGTIACNFSGPRRPYCGAARDYVLGSRIINGKGDLMHFGGEVMKNVAGYDVSRLMCGALGTLGLLLDISLKVIPIAEAETTLVQASSPQQALDNMHRWTLAALPLSASCYDGENLYIRLSSHPAEIRAAQAVIGGDVLENAESFWHALKEQQLAFFQRDRPLWRLSLGSHTAPLALEGDSFYDWGGALRWLSSDASADKIRHALESLDGHATLFKNSLLNTSHQQIDPFHELSPGLAQIHRNLKQAFDPADILNPGRMYADI